MPKYFIKIKSCGCIIGTFCDIFDEKNNEVHYYIGGHIHLNICKKCNQDEENGIDTLYDMYINDNITDGTGNDGWKECNYQNFKSYGKLDLLI